MSGCHSPNLQSKAKLPRKLRMRDQSGEIVSAKRKIESVHSVPSSLETVDWDMNSLCLLCSPLVKVRVQAAELTSCEWCTVQKLPTVFCQTTPAECLRLRLELGMSKVHRGHWYDCQNLSEQYFVLIFEKAPTATEEMALQEIFSKIYSGEDVLIDLQTSINEPDRKLLVYPPSPARGGITVTAEDLSCLNKGEFLNDVIIDFYLRFLLCEKLQKEEAGRCHLFSSFFFRHLSQTVRKDNGVADLSLEERRHTRVKTWTRHVNLFQKDFIFIPINQCAHWYLAVICFPGLVVHYSEPHLGHQAAPSAHRGPVTEGHTSTIHSGSTEPQPSLSPPNPMPCILIMDSLNCHAKPSVVRTLQEYLEVEWRVKMGTWQNFGKGVMEGWTPLVPQQDNFSDCGIYLLQYVESFLKKPPHKFHSKMDLSNWFPKRTVKKKREEIKELILGLHKQQQMSFETADQYRDMRACNSAYLSYEGF
ncbi:sentrin-specific protease 6 [Chanos chanos]|uniref:Sentrin-specific protease 6 n=1 Tax=Chanos chanos TaxID=29144 RepID=A0A6J2WG11_CHACN|nr:sentrin-specific protease 6-like [Chanos chanos]